MSNARDDDRAQIEWVFGLTGGELNDEAWAGFAYNYDGVPWYAESDHPDSRGGEYWYRTVVSCFLFSQPPETIVRDEGTWERCAVYSSSGETECPLRPEPVEDERCPLCDEPRGEEHGFIYLGDGWCEVVYRLALDEE